MTNGEPFRQTAISEPFGLGSGSASMAMRELRKLGYTFQSDNLEWVCTNPDHVPSEEQWDLVRAERAERSRQSKENQRAAARQQALAAARRDARREQQQQRSQVPARAEEPAAAPGPMHDLARLTSPNGILGIPGLEQQTPINMLQATPPGLGGPLQVFALILNDDGTLRMGVQNKDRKWVVDVAAEIER